VRRKKTKALQTIHVLSKGLFGRPTKVASGRKTWHSEQGCNWVLFPWQREGMVKNGKNQLMQPTTGRVDSARADPAAMVVAWTGTSVRGRRGASVDPTTGRVDSARRSCSYGSRLDGCFSPRKEKRVGRGRSDNGTRRFSTRRCRNIRMQVLQWPTASRSSSLTALKQLATDIKVRRKKNLSADHTGLKQGSVRTTCESGKWS